MRILTTLGMISPALILAACATHSGGNAPSMADILRDQTGQNGRACIWARDIRGYAVRDQKYVMIDGRRNYYIATVRPGCIDMATSASAIFGGSSNEICGGRIDSLATGDSHCTIDKIFEFTDREAAFTAYESALTTRQELRKAEATQ